MHQALYRKWRPKSFDEVYGQDHITSILKYEIENKKFSHAYLFCGSRGTGKTTCAKILAKAVNCLEPINGNPCGKCSACLAIESGAATDVLEMDAASNNGVDNIRDIRDEVVYSPSTLRYRVYIIDEVHMLSASAFNALLKTLEEPPEHVVFVLATTELHKLPATIISRCQRFDFRRITTDVLKDHLMRIAKKEGIEITESAATFLAKHAQGGMRDAISLLDLCAGNRKLIDDALVAQTIGSGGREEMLRVVRAIVQKDYDRLFEIVDDTVRSSRDITVFWQELISVYRDLLIIKSSREAPKYLDLTDSETKELSEIAKSFSIELLAYHSKMLNEALLTMLKANAVRRIVAELTLVRMCDERLSNSPEAMLARISALEQSVVSAPRAVITDTENKPATEAPSNNVKAESEQAKPARTRTKPKYDDDDDFRGDAPKASSQFGDQPSAKKAETLARTEAPVPANTGSVSAVRVLKPLKSRAEIMDLMDRRDPMLSGFFKQAKWYSDENGKIVLKFENSFEIESVKMFGGEKFIVEVISNVTGRNISMTDVAYECEQNKKTDEIIDRIIEASEE